MEEKGLIHDIQDLNRFNYVLVTRSSPTHVDKESFMQELVDKMSSGKKSIEQTAQKRGGVKDDHLLVTPYANLSQKATPLGTTTANY